MNEKGVDHSIEKILKFKINKKKKNLLTKKKGCFIYKIKYEGYDEGEDFSK